MEVKKTFKKVIGVKGVYMVKKIPKEWSKNTKKDFGGKMLQPYGVHNDKVLVSIGKH